MRSSSWLQVWIPEASSGACVGRFESSAATEATSSSLASSVESTATTEPSTTSLVLSMDSTAAAGGTSSMSLGSQVLRFLRLSAFCWHRACLVAGVFFAWSTHLRHSAGGGFVRVVTTKIDLILDSIPRDLQVS